MQKFYRVITESRIFKWMALVGVAVIVALWFYSIYEYSVNVLFFDAWDFHHAFVLGYSPMQQFTAQFGPHRMGPGLVITGFLNDMSGWNSNWISMAIGIMMFLSAPVYLLVKYKLFGRITFFDLSVFVIVLSLVQFEVFTISPFMSHSAVPALLTSLYVLSLFIRNLYARNILMLIINLNLVFSGYGLFAGVITILLFAIEIFSEIKSGKAQRAWVDFISLVLAIATLITFFIGYQMGYTENHTLILWGQPWKYLIFIFLVYAGAFGFMGYSVINVVIGMVAFVIVCVVLLKSLFGLIRNHDATSANNMMDRVLFVMTAYPVIFVVALSIGRIELGYEVAGSSRYIPYLVPSFVAVYFYLNSLRFPLKAYAVPVFFVLMVFLQINSFSSFGGMKYWSSKKLEWKINYLNTLDVKSADSLSNFAVHPNSVSTLKMLEYLKKNNLNLFLDADKYISGEKK